MVLLCSLDLGLVYNNLFFFIEPSLAVGCGKADFRTDKVRIANGTSRLEQCSSGESP